MAEQVIARKCCHCKQLKPLIEFRAHHLELYGKGYECKSCCRKYAREYYLKHTKERIEYAKQYMQNSGSKQKVKARRSHYAAQIKARNSVNNAIGDGRLLPPFAYHCRYCWKQAEQYHHHRGYEREHWFDIQPTCRKCHRKIHLLP
ncbi:MAG: hypothetical protein IMZ61_06560 [Planctomycetes bacterium]|nr:hypothetical protein [Planctomycetota bacterium]